MLADPKIFTDPEWKKVEKSITALAGCRHQFGSYPSEPGSFDLAGHHGIRRPVGRFDDRPKMRR